MSTEQLRSETLNILDPHSLSFTFTEEPFTLNLTLPDKTTYLNILALPAFPLSARQEFIHLYQRSEEGGIGKAIGIIEDTQKLTKENCTALNLLLKKICNLPIIISVTNIVDEFHFFHWFVETDRGSADFFMGPPRRHITPYNQNGLLIKDLKGDMYHIPDQATLDKKSQDSINLVF
jgi:hypothetical protein